MFCDGPCCWSCGCYAAKTKLAGRVAVVTGGNAGIGKATARALAKLGFGTVVVLARSRSKAQAAIKDIREASCASVSTDRTTLKARVVDLADLDSVANAARKLLRDLDRIDVLINNAGIMASPYATTPAGVEMQWATNVLGHFVLTLLLAPLMIETASDRLNRFPPRIINLSSTAHYGGVPNIDNLLSAYRGGDAYTPWGAYSVSKFGNVLLTQALARRFEALGFGSTIQVASAHPGVIRTGLWQHQSILACLMCPCTLKGARDGAKPAINLARADAITSGAFYMPTCCFVTSIGSDDATYSVTRQEEVWNVLTAQARHTFGVERWTDLTANNLLLRPPPRGSSSQWSSTSSDPSTTCETTPVKRRGRRRKSSRARSPSTSSPSLGSAASSAISSRSFSASSSTDTPWWTGVNVSAGVDAWLAHAAAIGYNHSQTACDGCCLIPHMLPCCCYNCC
ncbi:short chain dehydrogenase [Thecamonas trahens ATCC 50062]|uniref:Short chain dehydrogenase n=1 Tax=Thecamonas trahens ATCC 50062 TaxID=461836 RepID=A0A0L0D255_THETB|nr:short chain dehydrogenase [Thecamonas trahens ATCC 50062]KNC46362.1 short chain dehydrogenase [Thecamonas trahens ATCC 50062]|eukprot:XP_013760655.1 short chain dehydrogenase [Thecamonas trahens ATCC 50062]